MATTNESSRYSTSQDDNYSASVVSRQNHSGGNPYMYQQEHYLNESYDIEETRVDGTVNYLPEGNVLLCQINETITHTFALCLFDSGSTTNLLNQRALPVGITPLVLGPPQRFTTTQGTYSSPKYVKARNMSFPEFYKTR